MTSLEPKPEDIVAKLDSSVADTEENAIENWYSILQKGSKETESIEEKENKSIIEMRDRWSNWILFLIVLIVVFDMLLVMLVGNGTFSFTNTSIVIAVITDNFLKIVGLGYLITTEIFKKIYPRK